MEYICLSFEVEPVEPGSDVLMAALAETGFESFQANNKGFQAFIPKTEFSEKSIENLKKEYPLIKFSYTQSVIRHENWNKEWEKNFSPVEVEGYCRIRAHFHSPPTPPVMDVLIEPKMSFGTGHHPTTWLMIKALFENSMTARSFLDVGSGTGILAIVAKKLDSQNVTGIDIDEWSIENARENRRANGFNKQEIDFFQGTVRSIENRNFDRIAANINKNILISEMKTYYSLLNKGGILMLSGFFDTDCKELVTFAEETGFRLNKKDTKGEWAVLIVEKQ